ncbi:MAG: TetR/AcrR family transcriptional regulator [Oscillospiraceae bacterium]|nr:TetR/AcrR family transcriptional regulator [Oscillospiraceae bacterium]
MKKGLIKNMAPRALTEQEKCRQCEKLLTKGMAVVMSQGVKKVSVDDIAKAAGIAKGSFYQHFESKEKYMYALVHEIHEQMYERVAGLIENKSDIMSDIRGFLKNLWTMPEMIFFTQNHDEIIDIFNAMPDCRLQSAKQMEEEMYARLLRLAGIDTARVKPGVVHNFLHLPCLLESNCMIEDDVPKTIELLMDALVSYIFGGN